MTLKLKFQNFGSYSTRIDYTKQNLVSSFLSDDLNHIAIDGFHRFRNEVLPLLFKESFPVYSKNKNKILSLKKVIVGQPLRSFEKVRGSLGSYEFPIDLLLNYRIKEDRVKLSSINIYKNNVDAFEKWLKQKLNFQQPKLISEKNDVYVFANKIQNSSKKNKLQIKISVLSVKGHNLFFSFELQSESNVFFGFYPMISEKGTFLINGNEKVVVSQLGRAPGCYFYKLAEGAFSSEIIPKKGVWIDFVTRMSYKKGNRDVGGTTLQLLLNKNKGSGILLTDLFTFSGLDKNFVLDLLNNEKEIVNSYDVHLGHDLSKITSIVYSQISNSSENVTFNFKFNAVVDKFFQGLFLSKVGRHKLNHRLFVGNAVYNRVLAQNLVDYRSKKVIFPKGTWVSQKVWSKIKTFLKEGNNLLSLDFAKSKVPGSDKVQVVEVYCDNDKQDKTVKLVGVNPACTDFTLNVADLLALTSFLLNLRYGIGKVDDIDSLANRNIKSIPDILENRFLSGLNKVREEAMKRLNDLTSEKYNHKILSLVNSSSLSEVIREFFNISQLCQFLDQTNPLTELSSKRRITILGESGLKRESASAKVRDIHSSYFGKICPVETPEGPNIGLITNLAFYASLNEYNFIQTPYWKVKKGVLTKKIVYLSASEEEGLIIAPATTACDGDGQIVSEYLSVYLGDNLVTVHREDVEYLGYSGQQMFSVSAASIPFLEHDDANRALMGANMQKQAVPLIDAESPIVGTGNESLIARDSGFTLVNRVSGRVLYADSSSVKVKTKDNEVKNYYLTNFLTSNQNCAFFQNLLVKSGDLLKANQVIADGPSVKDGELAIGKNLLVAFTPWRGYNFEDALVISDRLVRADVFTSLHIEEYEIRRLRTALGDERFTNQVPNTSPESLRFLDENGIALIGSEVKPGDVLVGKVTVRSKGQLTPEDVLLNHLFHGRERNLDNNSLVVPNGGGGIVQKVCYFSQNDYKGSLPADVIEVVKISVVQKIPIKEGDKLCNRHGNKGIVSRILPASSMPFLVDGTPVDIMVNPLGVPSRMNVGQLLEMHFAYAANKLGYKVSTPIFNGANVDDLLAIMKESNLSPDGKETLYDGETGLPFDQRVAVGIMYFLKLSHMVETKIHARNNGPYALITQQPLKGKAQNGGQRFGEMEVWALESYGAAYNLQELLTIKSDDIKGRNNILRAIIDGSTKDFKFSHFPESFNVLLAEMRGLCLNVEVLTNESESTELEGNKESAV